MNRITFLLASILLIGCGRIGPPESLPLKPVILAHVVVGTKQVTEGREDSIGTHGSGIIIGHRRNRTYILTARHAAELSDLRVWPSKGRPSIQARIEKRHKDMDAAVISTRKINRPAIKISFEKVRQGRKVLVLGAPGKFFEVIYRRRILEFSKRKSPLSGAWIKPFILDGIILPGFSGGGVYNSQENLIGMCYARLPDRKFKGLCLATESIRDLVRPYIN